MSSASTRLAQVREASATLIAFGVPLALLILSIVIAASTEAVTRAEGERDARVQASILAGALTAPLAFDDRVTAREDLEALRANPDVLAAGAFEPGGARVAAYARLGAAPPRRAPRFGLIRGPGYLAVSVPAVQGTTRLGSVYLRLRTESAWRRAVRYFPIGAVVLMSTLLLGVFGSSNARLRRAQRLLEAEALERQKAEEQLRQAQKMEAMGQLTGGVAHDFNNLLMVATGGLELAERTADPARRERLMEGVRQALKRGADLTQQLLAFSRKQPLKTEVVDLVERVSAMRAVLDRSLREDIAIAIEAGPGLWPVEVDPAQFEVAVMNVAINARDAMPEGGRITFRAANAPGALRGGDAVRLEVADEGVGIPAESLARIFEPFFTTKEVGKGTGLGLAQVYGFARASGGEVRVESEIGVGTRIIFLLPRAEAAVAARTVAAPGPGATPGEDTCVLVVEDDDRVAELVEAMLTELRCRTRRVRDGEAALGVLAGPDRFDVVLSDMIMPGRLSGLELARAMNAVRPDVPVVLMTGYSDSAEAAAREGRPVLLKPYSLEALRREILAALSRRDDADGPTAAP